MARIGKKEHKRTGMECFKLVGFGVPKNSEQIRLVVEKDGKRPTFVGCVMLTSCVDNSIESTVCGLAFFLPSVLTRVSRSLGNQVDRIWICCRRKFEDPVAKQHKSIEAIRVGASSETTVSEIDSTPETLGGFSLRFCADVP